MWKENKKQGSKLTQPTVKEYGTLDKSFKNTEALKKIGEVIKSTKQLEKENKNGTT